MRIGLFILSLVCCLNSPLCSRSQSNPAWSGFGIESNVVAGKMIKHTPKFTGPISDRIYAVSLNFFKQTYGQKDWQQRRNYPVIGFGIMYINYNDPQVYGEAIGLYPTLQLPLVRGEKLKWTVRAGMGVCYVSKPYQRLPEPNTENVAIGGHWNNMSPFATDMRWHMDEHWALQAGFNFTHVSNAAFQQPNLGINTFGAHLGLRYAPVSSRPRKLQRDLQPLSNRWLLQAHAGIAFIEASPADGPLYPVYSIALFTSKRYWSKNKVLAGVDIYFNKAKYSYLKSKEHFPGHEMDHATQIAVFAGHEFLLGRVGLVFQAGYYLRRMAEQNEKFYQKLGGNLYLVQKEKGLCKEVFLSAMLKTHMATAELFEMGIGIGL